MSIIIIKKTSDKVGLIINAGELLQALSDKVFKNADFDAPILIHEASNKEDAVCEPLTAVFKCGSCDRLHLEAGWLDTSNIVLDAKSVIFQDYRDKEPKFIQRNELIEILSTIDKKAKVAISTQRDRKISPLTAVMKCSDECPSVHLTTGYELSNKLMHN